MHRIVLILIPAVLCVEFLIEDVGLLPNAAKYLPELLAMAACVILIVAGVQSRFQHVRPMYWIVFGAIAVSATCGAVVNSLEPGPLFAGIRTYLRAIPLFFLPAVVALSDRQLRTQLFWVGAFGVVQLPLAVQQRLETVALEIYTGDRTYGTLLDPSLMTLFLLPCAAVATAFFLRKRLSARRFALLLAVFLVPTMLNESKGALVLAPIVLLTVFFVATERGLRLRNMLWSVVALTAFLASAVVVYDRYKDPNSVDESVVDFFTDSERMQGYLDRDAQVGDGGEVNPGKLGSLRHALTLISRDPVTLIFGVGMGNLSLSKLGPEFEGAYVPLYRSLIGGSLSVMIGEFGLLGVGLLWVIYWLVFRDCLYVARRDPTIFGTLALGWTGAVVALFLGLGLAAPHSHVGLSMLFWYFSGLVVAQRARLEAAAVAERAHARRAPVPDPRGRQTTATT